MLDAKMGSIGKGIPGVKLEVLDEEDHPVPPGAVGEIVAQGQNITLGYWNAQSETEQSFREGKLYTGDLARVDEDGYIYVVDRAKDFLKCGGQRVSCREIESKILQFEGLVEAAVIGQDDDTLGEAVRLYVVHPEGDAVRAPLEQFCIENLAQHLVPRAIVFLDELPKNSSGKLDKLALKHEFRAQIESEGHGG
jgi:long-chain acyl-CoA synthetase